MIGHLLVNQKFKDLKQRFLSLNLKLTRIQQILSKMTFREKKIALKDFTKKLITARASNKNVIRSEIRNPTLLRAITLKNSFKDKVNTMKSIDNGDWKQQISRSIHSDLRSISHLGSCLKLIHNLALYQSLRKLT
jgi:hypothetical protein